MRISDWSSDVCSSDLGTIAVAGSLLLFILPDGTGRPLLLWKEADRAPWGVIMMFGGGLALAAAITASGLAAWLGAVLTPLGSVPTILLAATIVEIGRASCREREGQYV